MSVAVQMICSDRSDRHAVGLDATLRDATFKPIDVEIEDISISGFRMSTTTELRIGELITVGISGLGMQPAVVVRQTAGRYGCRFVNFVSQDYIDQLDHEPMPEIVTTFLPASNFPQVSPAGDIERYPPVVRLGIMAGLGAASWALVIVVVKLIFF